MQVIITGASGGGKTTLVNALSARGYATSPEMGRLIVRRETARGGGALPWGDRAAFRDLLFVRSLAAFDAAAGRPCPTVFDRSFVEALAFGEIIGAPSPPGHWREARTRLPRGPVFVCPPWRAIHRMDEERRHGFGFALRDCAANVAAYRALGCPLIEVPRAPVAARAAFVMSRIGAAPG